MKKETGAVVTVITCGGDFSEKWLRYCLALGADRAVLISANNMNSLLDEAKAVSNFIIQEQFDIILTGSFSEDYCTSAYGSIIAELINLPHINNICEISYAFQYLIVTEYSYKNQIKKYRCPKRILLTVKENSFRLRYPSYLSRKNADKKQIIKIDDQILLSSNERSSFTRFLKPVEINKAKILEGTHEEISNQLLCILKDEGIIS